MRKLFTFLPLAILVSFATGSLTGCGEKEPEPSKETQQQADRLSKIRTSSGGDWNKVSDADKEWLIKEVCFGNEGSAKMMVSPPPKPNVGPNRGAPPGAPKGP